ncbi:GNAT family N-acetyltransferase [Kineosporia rhizophila]|uniref:GNAT family N-acetyltransferase n=1 Tax=Kineosporia rhizophila TaxID=84633 RepID=UPI000AC11F52|nr:GNAT family N-acetyltransferase [Kineosporia rhizophila]
MADQRRQPKLDLSAGHRLRPWSTADAPMIPLAMTDPLIRQYASQLLDDRDAALAAIHSWSDGWGQGNGAAWAITGPGEQLLGQIRFGLFDEHLGAGSVGYWLLPEARGRGLAGQALTRASSVVFRRMSWHRIELYHAVENRRSCNVARRAGYPQEGVMRGAMLYPVDGRRSDEHLHARLASDPEP